MQVKAEKDVVTNVLSAADMDRVSSWSHSRGKRCVDVAVSSIGLTLLTPVILGIALAVAICSGLPILFRQERLGKGGRPFWLLKFRTMTVAAPGSGPGVTCAGDCRVTAIGRLLRRNKL